MVSVIQWAKRGKKEIRKKGRKNERETGNGEMGEWKSQIMLTMSGERVKWVGEMRENENKRGDEMRENEMVS